MSFHIDHVQDLELDESPFDNLILRADIKNTIQSIIWSYKQSASELKAWSADFIQEKGEGQIFLLHGTPGVGKTCTAGEWLVAPSLVFAGYLLTAYKKSSPTT